MDTSQSDGSSSDAGACALPVGFDTAPAATFLYTIGQPTQTYSFPEWVTDPVDCDISYEILSISPSLITDLGAIDLSTISADSLFTIFYDTDLQLSGGVGSSVAIYNMEVEATIGDNPANQISETYTA